MIWSLKLSNTWRLRKHHSHQDWTKPSLTPCKIKFLMHAIFYENSMDRNHQLVKHPRTSLINQIRFWTRRRDPLMLSNHNVISQHWKMAWWPALCDADLYPTLPLRRRSDQQRLCNQWLFLPRSVYHWSRILIANRPSARRIISKMFYLNKRAEKTIYTKHNH